MTFRTAANDKARSGFAEAGTSGVFIFRLEPDRESFMNLLRHNGLRPPTFIEIITMANRSPDLKAQLKEKRFYLSGEAPSLSGYSTINGSRELVRGRGDVEETICFLKGNGPLLLVVNSDHYATNVGSRFDIFSASSIEPQIVVGIKISNRIGAKALVRV